MNRDPIRGKHEGQRSYAPRQQAGQMTAPDQTCIDIEKTLANNAPSTDDPRRNCGQRTRAAPSGWLSRAQARGVMSDIGGSPEANRSLGTENLCQVPKSSQKSLGPAFGSEFTVVGFTNPL